MFAGKLTRSRHRKTPSANASFFNKSDFEYLNFSFIKKIVSVLFFLEFFLDFKPSKTYDLNCIVLAVEVKGLSILHIIEILSSPLNLLIIFPKS